jgi:hypothetical protein
MKVTASLLVLCCAVVIARAEVTFTMMIWTNDWTNLPTAVGLKPSYNNTNDGVYTTLDSDWLLWTPDDKEAVGYNFFGALSHKFNDRVGDSGMTHGGYESANSLTGYVTLALAEAAPNLWSVDVTDFYTVGSKANNTSTAQMSYSYLVTTNFLYVVTNSYFGLDGLGNTGVWHSSDAGNWSLAFSADSFAQTPGVQHTEEYKQCLGCIIPVAQLTTGGLAVTQITNPSGYYTNDFEQYLLNEIAPRVPVDARYLLFVQILKSHILYSTNPAHVNSNQTLFGECWFATTPDELIPEPALLLAGAIGAFALGARRRRG